MQSSANDKRLFPRREVAFEILVIGGQEKCFAEVKDLTVNGIFFLSKVGFTPGSELEISFMQNKAAQSAELKAVTLRCDKDESESPWRYLVAAKFIESNDQYIMDALAIVHGQK